MVPNWIIAQGDDLTLQRARLFVVTLAGTGALALVSGLFHLFFDTPARGIFNIACAPLALLVLLLFHAEAGRGQRRAQAGLPARPNLRPALDLLLAILVVATSLGSALSKNGFHIPVAIVVVPFLAATLGGHRAGMLWTTFMLSVIGAMTTALWGDPVRSLVGANAWLVAGVVGIGGCFVEGAREHAQRAAESAILDKARLARERDDQEAELRSSRELLALAFRRTPAMLILSELATRRIVDVNACFERLSGWTLAEAEGRTLTELDAWISPEDPARLVEAMVSGSRTRDVEIRMRTKSGRELWLLAAADIIDMNGVRHILAQAVDITDRKRAEQALAASRKRLEERVVEGSERLQAAELARQRQLTSIGILAAGIAHQINNPIASIMASAEYALLTGPESPERGDDIRTAALRTAIGEAARCGQIVKNVLRFARQQPTARWVEDLVPVVLRAATLCRGHVADQGGELELGSSPERIPVLMSPIEIEQVLVHLVRNGAEALVDGGLVRVAIERRGELAVVSIDDEGRGMPPEQAAHLFEPFYTTRVQQGGTGLGLAFDHGVIRDHGGEIKVESELGKGTRIRILLPLAMT